MSNKRQIKALKTLARVRRHSLDEIRREVMEYQAALDRAEEQISAIKTAISNEKLLVSENPEYFQSLGHFLNISQSQIDLYSHEKINIEKSIEQARDRLRDQFQEVKRVEIAYESMQHDMDKEQKRAETKTLDEIGTQRSARAKK